MKHVWSNNSNYDHIIKWCLEEVLHLPYYKLVVQYNALSFSSNAKGNFVKPNIINIDQYLDKEETIRVLFHEIRHFHQFITGKYFFDKEDLDFTKGIKIPPYKKSESNRRKNKYGKYDSLVKSERLWWGEMQKNQEKNWKNMQFWLQYNVNYLHSPWEIDARKFAVETYGKYLSRGKVDSTKYIWQGNYENYDNNS